MFKFLALAGLLFLMFVLFGLPTLPWIIGGIILFVWMVKRGRRSPQSPAEIQWFIPCDKRGNRFMIVDPLDAPSCATDSERESLLRELLPLRQFDSDALALRHRILSEPNLLKTADGIDMMNGIGINTYHAVATRVSRWQTNDFRRLGVELVVA